MLSHSNTRWFVSFGFNLINRVTNGRPSDEPPLRCTTSVVTSEEREREREIGREGIQLFDVFISLQLLKKPTIIRRDPIAFFPYMERGIRGESRLTRRYRGNYCAKKEEKREARRCINNSRGNVCPRRISSRRSFLPSFVRPISLHRERQRERGGCWRDKSSLCVIPYDRLIDAQAARISMERHQEFRPDHLRL